MILPPPLVRGKLACRDTARELSGDCSCITVTAMPALPERAASALVQLPDPTMPSSPLSHQRSLNFPFSNPLLQSKMAPAWPTAAARTKAANAAGLNPGARLGRESIISRRCANRPDSREVEWGGKKERTQVGRLACASQSAAAPLPPATLQPSRTLLGLN